MATLRRAKWQPPTPRRPRRRQQQQGKLETLFGQEREFSYATPPVVLLNSGRERSEEEGEEKLGIWEDKWRFQAEMLRAECKFLRMERQIDVRRLDRERVFMETTLKSALHSLISARRKVGETQNVSSVLEEEIKELAKKLAEIQRLSKKKTIRRDPELLKEARPSSDLDCVIDVRKVLKAYGSETPEQTGFSRVSNRFLDVEILTRKMEGLSEGKLLKKMEDEYGSTLTRTANTSAANSQRYDQFDLSSSSSTSSLQEKNVSEQKTCAGHCKVIVRRIMEQVRAETEQWSQMQEMLGQVREEMEHLQVSRDFWQGRALDYDNKIQSLNAAVNEWKQKALSLEVEPQEKEKRVLTCRVKGKDQEHESSRKESHQGKSVTHKGCKSPASPNRYPFRDIGNCT
ncbi:hypothetical protein V2J09_006204 [Rumex salicifolius]